MKAILIDPFTQTISEVDYDGNYKNIYKLIEANCFDLAHLDRGDAIFVDDAGLINGTRALFKHEDYHSVLAGKGLILGSNNQGASISCKATLEETKRKVKFVVWLDDEFQLAEGSENMQ